MGMAGGGATGRVEGNPTKKVGATGIERKPRWTKVGREMADRVARHQADYAVGATSLPTWHAIILVPPPTAAAYSNVIFLALLSFLRFDPPLY